MKTLKQFWAILIILLLWAGSAPAQAALAIIVHPSNSLSGISADQAADIYLAKVGVFPNGKSRRQMLPPRPCRRRLQDQRSSG